MGSDSAPATMMEVSDNAKGLALAVASSAFIGVSFILKKIGLRRAAKCGARAGTSCYRPPRMPLRCCPYPLLHLFTRLLAVIRPAGPRIL